MIGDMAMPADFKYKDVFLKGQPPHETFDPFRLRYYAAGEEVGKAWNAGMGLMKG